MDLYSPSFALNAGPVSLSLVRPLGFHAVRIGRKPGPSVEGLTLPETRRG